MPPNFAKPLVVCRHLYRYFLFFIFTTNLFFEKLLSFFFANKKKGCTFAARRKENALAVAL